MRQVIICCKDCQVSEISSGELELNQHLILIYGLPREIQESLDSRLILRLDQFHAQLLPHLVSLHWNPDSHKKCILWSDGISDYLARLWS